MILTSILISKDLNFAQGKSITQSWNYDVNVSPFHGQGTNYFLCLPTCQGVSPTAFRVVVTIVNQGVTNSCLKSWETFPFGITTVCYFQKKHFELKINVNSYLNVNYHIIDVSVKGTWIALTFHIINHITMMTMMIYGSIPGKLSEY